MELYFSQHFGIDVVLLEDYGALDISIVSDLPLFIDPFLLFHSDKPEYQALHEQIIDYLKFLRDQSRPDLDPGLIKAWYRFGEVKQNWLGFTLFGNEGHALGDRFARSLNASLSSILNNFGDEQITQSSHLEKLSLISAGVGRDSISDFTTNLIKGYLCQYTQTFALEHLTTDQRTDFAVPRSDFNYATRSWQTVHYTLPKVGKDYVLLTPLDMLTMDDTWISHSDMVNHFTSIPPAVEDAVLRAEINQYFYSRLSEKPTQKERVAAAQSTLDRYPELIDRYIRQKEDLGDQAEAVSAQRTDVAREALVHQVQTVIPDLESKTDFYDKPWTSYDEAKERVILFKDYVENQDGYKVINRAGKPFSRETEVQLFFGLIWCKSEFDVNREPNNGRGPVDFKVSYGSGDKSLIEFKLAKSSSLKRNLEKQVEIYEKANGTRSSVKVVICYTEDDQLKAGRVLRELGLVGEKSIVLIDARSDNKPSGSKA